MPVVVAVPDNCCLMQLMMLVNLDNWSREESGFCVDREMSHLWDFNQTNQPDSHPQYVIWCLLLCICVCFSCLLSGCSCLFACG